MRPSSFFYLISMTTGMVAILLEVKERKAELRWQEAVTLDGKESSQSQSSQQPS